MKKLFILLTITLSLLSVNAVWASNGDSASNSSNDFAQWVDQNGKVNQLDIPGKSKAKGLIRIVSEDSFNENANLLEEVINDSGAFMVVGNNPIVKELQSELDDKVIPETSDEDKIAAYGLMRLPSGKEVITYYIVPKEQSPGDIVSRLALSLNEDLSNGKLITSQKESTVESSTESSSVTMASTRDWKSVIDDRYVLFEKEPLGQQKALITIASSRNESENRHDWLTHTYHEVIPGLALGDEYDGYVNWRQRVDFEVEQSPDGGQPLLGRSEPSSSGENTTVSVSLDSYPSYSWQTYDTSIERDLGSNENVGWLMKYNNQTSARAENGHSMEPAAEYQLDLDDRFSIDYYFSAVWGDNISARDGDLDRFIGFTVYPEE